MKGKINSLYQKFKQQGKAKVSEAKASKSTNFLRALFGRK